MTPKEKAEELYCKYDSLFKAPFKKHQDLKQCALIAVNEMLEELDHLAFDDFDYGTSKMMYWQEVKEEIKNL